MYKAWRSLGSLSLSLSLYLSLYLPSPIEIVELFQISEMPVSRPAAGSFDAM
jgi:hypothetical protein